MTIRLIAGEEDQPVDLARYGQIELLADFIRVYKC